MTTLEELILAEKLEKVKQQNAAYDAKTRDLLFPLVQARFDGRKISEGCVTLKAHLLDEKAFDRVCLKIHNEEHPLGRKVSPGWQHVGMILLAARYLPNGKYHLE